MSSDSVKNFFISYNKADRAWAEWIGWLLEDNGYTCLLQAWDFLPGRNFVLEMQRASSETQRTIAVLSPDYLTALYTQSEWASAFVQDPTGKDGKLLPVRVRDCQPEGLLTAIIYIDLFDLDESAARKALLEGVKQTRVKPLLSPDFPGRKSPLPAFPGIGPAVQNIPFPRNPFFTGRDQELEQLHDRLQQNMTAAIGQIQSISGLGGIGKTQLAIEYAYRYHDEYQYVLWALAESVQTLTTSFSEIAGLLNLSEKDAEVQDVTIQAVKRWLQQQSGWLLILDNADSPALLPDFLPPTVAGHLLITTRAAEVNTHLAGLAHPLVVETFSDEQGAYFLLQRSGRLAPDATLNQAEKHTRQQALSIAHELGGLPLALDQAGAYLKATGSSLSTYLQIYQQHHAQLLSERRGKEHPEPVATTWDIAFSKVEQQNPAAADLLRLCAFLAPDAIPEEIFTEGAEELGPTLAPVAADPYLFNQAIESLCAYSLVTRDPQAQTLTVHRLVQAVLRDKLPTRKRKGVATRRQWMQRAVNAIVAAHPELEFANWPTIERLLPHALTCASWIEQTRLTTDTGLFLLNYTGLYLRDRARYKEAELLLQRALTISEQVSGATHPDTASSLNALALLYHAQGRYEEAEPLFRRAFSICEQQLGATHPKTATSLNNLAELYHAQGRYEEAEPLFRRALPIHEQQLGATHPKTAASLNNLALLCQAQGRYEEAEPLYLRALSIHEQQLGASSPSTATSLNNLALLYHAQGRYEEAEPLLQRALAIYEQQLGASHPDTASGLNALAEVYDAQGRYEEAEPLYLRALAICEQQLGARHPSTATGLNNLAGLYYMQGRYEEAEPLYLRALSIYEQQPGREHPTAQQIRENYDILLQTIEWERIRES